MPAHPSSTRLPALLLGCLFLGALTQPRARAEEPAATFDEQTREIEQSVSEIVSRVGEVQGIRQRTGVQDSPIKTSCVDEKLRHVRASLQSAKVVMSGWKLARTNRGYGQRSLSRMRILKLYATAATDGAYACSDGRAGTTTMKTDFKDPALPMPLGLDVVRPPNIERPPLASPY